MILMVGALVATYVARWMVEKFGAEDPDIAWDALIWALVAGVIGARLYHVFTPSQSLLDVGIDTMYYLTHPIDILTIWRGGLGIPGGIAGGAIGVYLYARKNGLDHYLLFDAAAPAVALAQAIGRWGNFVNQELYGPPTDLPWGIFIRPENRMSPYIDNEYFHPLFLYESIWNLLNAIFLYWLWKRFPDRLKRGDLFFTYLITYPLGRFLLEFIRLDYVPMFGINFNQGLSLVVGIISAIALYRRHQGQQPQMKPTGSK